MHPSTVIQLSDDCPYRPEEDFEIYQIEDGQWHWEGLNDYEEFCCEDGLQSERYAIADAIYQLCDLTGDYSHEQAVAFLYEQGLPVHQFADAFR